MEGQRPLAALLRSSRHTTSVADPDDFFPDPTQRSGFGSLILKIITGTGTVIISKSKLSLLFKTFYLQIFLFVVLKFIPELFCFFHNFLFLIQNLLVRQVCRYHPGTGYLYFKKYLFNLLDFFDNLGLFGRIWIRPDPDPQHCIPPYCLTREDIITDNQKQKNVENGNKKFEKESFRIFRYLSTKKRPFHLFLQQKSSRSRNKKTYRHRNQH